MNFLDKVLGNRIVQRGLLLAVVVLALVAYDRDFQYQQEKRERVRWTHDSTKQWSRVQELEYELSKRGIPVGAAK